MKSKIVFSNEDLVKICKDSFANPTGDFNPNEFNSPTNLNECTQFINLIVSNRNSSNNNYYYSLGKCFKFAKIYCMQEKISLLDYVEANIKQISISNINYYIKFVDLCDLNSEFIYCNLQFKFIRTNMKRLIEINTKNQLQ